GAGAGTTSCVKFGFAAGAGAGSAGSQGRLRGNSGGGTSLGRTSSHNGGGRGGRRPDRPAQEAGEARTGAQGGFGRPRARRVDMGGSLTRRSLLVLFAVELVDEGAEFLAFAGREGFGADQVGQQGGEQPAGELLGDGAEAQADERFTI